MVGQEREIPTQAKLKTLQNAPVFLRPARYFWQLTPSSLDQRCTSLQPQLALESLRESPWLQRWFAVSVNFCALVTATTSSLAKVVTRSSPLDLCTLHIDTHFLSYTEGYKIIHESQDFNIVSPDQYSKNIFEDAEVSKALLARNGESLSLSLSLSLSFSPLLSVLFFQENLEVCSLFLVYRAQEFRGAASPLQRHTTN